MVSKGPTVSHSSTTKINNELFPFAINYAKCNLLQTKMSNDMMVMIWYDKMYD